MLSRTTRIALILIGATAILGGGTAYALLRTSHDQKAIKSHTSGARTPPSCPRKGRFQPVDPRTAMSLPDDGLTPAIRAAQAKAGRSGVVEEALRDPAEARSMCGRHIANRTVLVHISYPKERKISGSLAYGAKLLIARFPGNHYRVWFVLHA